MRYQPLRRYAPLLPSPSGGHGYPARPPMEGLLMPPPMPPLLSPPPLPGLVSGASPLNAAAVTGLVSGATTVAAAAVTGSRLIVVALRV